MSLREPCLLDRLQAGCVQVAQGGAVSIPPEGGLQNGGEVFLGDRDAHVRQNPGKVVIADDAQVLLTELMDDLDELPRRTSR